MLKLPRLMHGEKSLQKWQVAEEEEGAADEAARFWFSTSVFMPIKQDLLQVFLPQGGWAEQSLQDWPAPRVPKYQVLKTAAVLAKLAWLKGVGRGLENVLFLTCPLTWPLETVIALVRYSCRHTHTLASSWTSTFILVYKKSHRLA